MPCVCNKSSSLGLFWNVIISQHCVSSGKCSAYNSWVVIFALIMEFHSMHVQLSQSLKDSPVRSLSTFFCLSHSHFPPVSSLILCFANSSPMKLLVLQSLFCQFNKATLLCLDSPSLHYSLENDCRQ